MRRLRAPLRALRDELAEIVSLAPIRAPHAAERRRDNAPFAGEERGNETPPVRVGSSAVQEDQTRLAALAPGEGFHLAPSTAVNVRSGSIATTRSNHAGAGLLPAEGRERRDGVDSARERSLGSGDFEQSRCAHAAADAHRDDDMTRATPLAFDQRVTGHARAAHAVGMADRDCTAVDVELVIVDAEPVAAVDDLDRERFVELPEADVVHLETMRLSSFGTAKTGPIPISSGSQPATAMPR